eukprot:jgi/Tetstr1/447374/TSEL_034811.t1
MGFKQKIRAQKKLKTMAAADKAARTPPMLLGESPDLIMATLVDLFHKIGHNGGGALYSAILMHELVPGSDLVEGYGIIDDRMCFYNVWVEANGEKYDPSTAILRVLETTFTEPVVLSPAPRGDRVDLSDTDSLANNVKSLQVYRQSPQKWWEQVPAGFARIRKFMTK